MTLGPILIATGRKALVANVTALLKYPDDPMAGTQGGTLWAWPEGYV